MIERVREAVFDYLAGLSNRDRLVLLLGLPVVLFLALAVFVLSPVSSLKKEYLRKSQTLKERIEKLRPRVERFSRLKAEVEPALRKVKRGSKLDVADYVKRKAHSSSLEIKDVKVSVGRSVEGVEVKTVTVRFSEVPLNRLTRFVKSLESSPYYFKSTSIEVSDMDENGLVSGKVTFNFVRSEGK